MGKRRHTDLEPTTHPKTGETDMEKMEEFHFRANYEYFKLPGGGHLILYEDHRSLLNVLFEARRLIGLSSPNLIYFDYHDDAVGGWTLPRILDTLGRRSFDEVAPREFWSFVEFDLGERDNDWLVAGMEAGLIRDAVLVGLQNYDKMVRPHIDSSGRVHHYYSIPHLDFSLSAVGPLCIGERNCIHDKIREVFGYSDGIFDANYPPFVLDFDLGCFAADFVEKTIAWPERLFREKYVGENGQISDFMKKLAARASVVTICRESGCCGGIGEANKILSYLDRYFFDGTLKAQPYY